MTPREKDKPHNWWTATTEADSPEPPVLSVQDEPGTEVREEAPPTPGAYVAKDPEHPTKCANSGAQQSDQDYTFSSL